MTIRDSTQIPPYKNDFDTQQLEMEQYLAHYLQNNTTADEATAGVLSRAIVKAVLGEFRPDMFEEK